jgi:hypothetical protein
VTSDVGGVDRQRWRAAVMEQRWKAVVIEQKWHGMGSKWQGSRTDNEGKLTVVVEKRTVAGSE